MENIRLPEGGWPYFWNIQKQPFRGARKDTSHKYFFSNSKKMYLVEFVTIYKVLEQLWMAAPHDSDDKILLFNNKGPPESNRMSFCKTRFTKNTSLVKKKIRLVSKMFYRKRYREVWSDKKLSFGFAKDQLWAEIT